MRPAVSFIGRPDVSKHPRPRHAAVDIRLNVRIIAAKAEIV
jgi:hypothetical protein